MFDKVTYISSNICHYLIAATALTRPRVCAGSSDHYLLVDGIIINISDIMNTLIFANEQFRKQKEEFNEILNTCKNKNAVIRQSYAACSYALVIDTNFHTFAIRQGCCQ